jgi:hypothetical protein
MGHHLSPLFANLAVKNHHPQATASLGDVAPDQSPAEVVGLVFSPGHLLTFLSDGSPDHCDFGGCGLAGVEGDLGEGSFGHTTGAENGLSNVIAPIGSARFRIAEPAPEADVLHR